MRQRYLLRGIGIGIIIGALIMFGALRLSGDTAADDKEGQATQLDAENGAAGDGTDEPQQADTEELTSGTSEEPQTDTEEVTAGEAEEPQTDTESEEPQTASESQDISENPAAEGGVEIQVVRGMHSGEVCELLAEGGIIEDASDFDAWLVENGYATQIGVNTYTFTQGMTYEEIADILVNTPQE